MSVDSATITRAVVVQLAALGLGEWTEEGKAASGDLPLLVEWFMPSRPDRVIVVSTYDEVTDAPGPARGERDHAVWYVQVRVRDYRADTAATAEAIRRALEGHHQEWDGLRVSRVLRESFAPMGVEGSTMERSDNYAVTAGRS